MTDGVWFRLRPNVIVGEETELVRRFRLKRELEILPTQPTPVAAALDAANHYFRMKAAQVLESDDAVALLAELRQRNCFVGDALDRFSSRGAALALAMLAAAGFCDVWPDEIRITAEGAAFLDWLEEKGGDRGQATGDSAKA